ncbi:MAG: methyl-accepting chemotaxis protein [Lachnospiraceae bacterium]|nr:methyl-accepting chemotaxis protein [Lachnospiraceae bacterium]
MKVRRLSITAKILLVVTALLLVADAAMGIILVGRAKEALLNQINDKILAISNSAATNFDPELLRDYTEEDAGTDKQQQILDALVVFRDHANIEYIYTIKEAGPKEFIFVVDSDPEEPADYGDEVEYTDALYEASKGTPSVDAEPYTDEWGTHYSGYSPVFDGDEVVGIIGIDISADLLEEQVGALTGTIFVICAMSLIIGILIIFLFTFSIKKGFATLGTKLEDIADGSGDLTKSIELRSGDELEAVGDKVNGFIGQVRELVRGVSEVSEDVLRSGRELQETAGSSAESVRSINSEIESISSGMQECGAATATTAEALADASRDIEALSDEISKVHEIVDKASVNASEAARLATEKQNNAVRTLKSIEDHVNAASADAARIEQVKEIADQINEIASQTQILSLNAQIEAARAGEQGKGFAVVATEVGHLSSEISEAVGRISEINNQVISAVKKLLDSSREMSEFMGRTVVADYEGYAKVGQDYGETTLSIDESLQNLQTNSMRIASLVHQVDESISDISNSVNDCAQRASGLAQTASGIAGSMDTLERVADENEAQARRLEDRISKYRY